MSVSSIKSQGRKDRRANNTGGRPSRQGYIQWEDRNHRNNSPSSPEPGIKPRGGRMRGVNAEKSPPSDGVYANPRMMHAATSIVGCVVQVQVRNGAIYEGILKTFSPKMDVVLELAHKLDDIQGAVPSKDRLIETVIFKLSDVIAISAASVELEYANKDSFTDTAISKFNGQVTEKELQPWEADGPNEESLESLEADGSAATAPQFPRRGKAVASIRRDKDNRSGTPPGRPGQGLGVHGRSGQNGWDANDMFKINAEQFNVKSSYDPSLPQYTTPLKPDNSKEFKDREARAAKLAHEIERSEAYRQHIDLENGDGDDGDSPVVRETNPLSNSTSGKLDLQNVVVKDRYVPPHMRKNHPGRQMRQGPRAKSPAAPNPPPATSPVARQPSPQQPDTDKLNGDKEDRSAEASANDKAGEPVGVTETQSEKEHSQNVGKQDTRKSQRGRESQMQELKEFGTNKFVLSDSDPPSSSKEREKKGGSHSASPQPTQQAASPAGSPQTMTQPSLQPGHSNVPNATLVEKLPQDGKKSESPDKKKSDIDMIAEKSTLNPLAKEFIYNPMAKPFTPKQQPMPVPTPPRPHTQSPVMMHPMQAGMGQTIYPSGIYVTPQMPGQQAVLQQQQQQQRLQKRAVVSVQQRPDFNQAAQAAAAAATGQPLMANNMSQQTQYHMQYMPSASVQQVRYSQMVPMPGARMVAPGLGQQGHDPGQVQQGQGQTVFVSPPGGQAVPAHLQHHHNAGPNQPHPAQPTHMAPHQQATPPHNQQPSHMNSQAAGHPAPSPVQHHPQHHPHHPQQHQHHTPHHAPTQHQHHPGVPTAGGQQPMPGHHPQAHPPNTNTPQPPHLIYQASTQMTQQPHPPLQPSPHTPTSPQSMHPQQLSFPQPFSYTTQTGVQGGAQMSYAHNHPHTTVTHAQHQQHTHAPQIIMMQPQHQAQMAPTAGPPGHLQHGPPQAPLMQGPVHGQAGPHMVPQQTMNVSSGSMHPQQIHYMSHHPQMPSQHPPTMPTFQHNQ